MTTKLGQLKLSRYHQIHGLQINMYTIVDLQIFQKVAVMYSYLIFLSIKSYFLNDYKIAIFCTLSSGEVYEMTGMITHGMI